MKYLLVVTFLMGAAFAQADTSDFLSLCLADDNVTDKSACKPVHARFFQGDTKHFAPLTPAQVGAPAMSVDPKVQFLIFNDPNYVAGIAYCYFAFRKWIDPEQVSPDGVGLTASGFSILKERLPEYQAWLVSSKEGKACKTRVLSESGVEVANLEVSLRDHTALIGVNPLALVREHGGQIEVILKEMARTLNHERVHAYQVLCPSFEKWSRAQWERLSSMDQEKVKKRYPSYNWKDPLVAARESAAFALEADPKQMVSHLGTCAL